MSLISMEFIKSCFQGLPVSALHVQTSKKSNADAAQLVLKLTVPFNTVPKQCISVPDKIISQEGGILKDRLRTGPEILVTWPSLDIEGDVDAKSVDLEGFKRKYDKLRFEKEYSTNRHCHYNTKVTKNP